MNVVRNENERSGSLFSRQDADNFNSFIDNSSLIPLPLGGRLFTCMKKAGTKLSKLDRFLISEEVAEALLDVRVTVIDCLWSDHNLILLHVSKSDFGHTPFKLFHSKLLCDSFDELELSNSETKTSDRVTKHDNLQLIKSIEEKIKACSANDDDRDYRIKLLQEVDKLNIFESFDLFQKERIKWDIEEGVWISDPPQIKKEFLNFFNEKFKDHDSNVDFPLFANSSGLCALDRDNLEPHVSLDEVKNAVWDCDSSKAPGLDGSTSSFSTLIPKVDFEKAFDLVSWKYLNFVLITLGFGSKWRSWIRASFSSFRASGLANGSPTSEFSIKRGLRQGDPLSPFLCILVMEGLHNALSTAVSSGLIRGVKFGSPEVTIAHLFYADDVIIITKWNANDLDTIIRVLQVFYLASGLKINIQKSNIYGIGVSDVDVSSMASNF
ncbi:RNA-directed DNA polymerase, eukaryota, reverse transcriptase zinc-binding domain protein [Tanacetum coccineum]